MDRIRKVVLQYYFRFLCKLNYNQYKKKYPQWLKKCGIRFSGDINKTGFIAANVNFDSQIYWPHISLGENTIISSDVLVLVHDYSIATAIQYINENDVTVGKMPHFVRDVVIGNNVFIGAKSILLPGTRIGNGVIIGAGSVLRGEIPDNSIVIGNPGTIVGQTTTFAHKHMEKEDYII